MNAISDPSGEKNGALSAAELFVSCTAVPPLVGTIQISPRHANASVPPSGDSAGSFANLIVCSARPLADITAATSPAISPKVSDFTAQLLWNKNRRGPAPQSPAAHSHLSQLAPKPPVK